MKCKACGKRFHDEPWKIYHDSYTAEELLRMHIFENINGGDLDHIFAYPELSIKTKEKIPMYIQEYEKVSISKEMGPWKWDMKYFYEARVKDKVLYIIFKSNTEEKYYIRDYKIHLVVDDDCAEAKLKKITKMAECKFYYYPAAFWVVKINEKYAIVSRNFDSDIDKFCKSVYSEVE